MLYQDLLTRRCKLQGGERRRGGEGERERQRERGGGSRERGGEGEREGEGAHFVLRALMEVN